MDESRARDLLERERDRIERALAELERPDEHRSEPQGAGDGANELYDEERDAGYKLSDRCPPPQSDSGA